MRRRKKGGYMISSVSETYQVHPQTLRLYERVGLLKPSRTEGNTRFYTDEDLERLETILNLTRDMGINLAGVEVILNMREKMDKMRKELEDLVQYVHENVAARERGGSVASGALVRVGAVKLVRTRDEKQ